MSIKQMTEILYTYDINVIDEAKKIAGKLIPRKKKEEPVEYDFSFDDKYFSIFY